MKYLIRLTVARKPIEYKYLRQDTQEMDHRALSKHRYLWFLKHTIKSQLCTLMYFYGHSTRQSRNNICRHKSTIKYRSGSSDTIDANISTVDDLRICNKFNDTFSSVFVFESIFRYRELLLVDPQDGTTRSILPLLC